MNLPRIIHTSEGPGHPGGKTCSAAARPLVGNVNICCAQHILITEKDKSIYTNKINEIDLE